STPGCSSSSHQQPHAPLIEAEDLRVLIDNGRDDLPIQRLTGTPGHQTAQLQLPGNLLRLHPMLTRGQQVHHGFLNLHYST
ncbi:MAG: hypothetical protein IKZ60_02760, partial [Bacteroidales bacterium]|nr:hypothetical protein [Bacteroidales bacterium]